MLKRFMAFLLVVTMICIGTVGCTSDDETKKGSANKETNEATEEVTEEATEETTEEATEVEQPVVKEELEIAVIHMTLAAQAQQRAFDGLMAHIEKNEWNWNVTSLNSEGSGEKMASNIEDAVAKGVDMIIVLMADLRASTAAIKVANDAGIPIISIDSQYTPGVIVDITSNNYVMSAKVSSYLVDRLGGVGNVAILALTEHHGVRKRLEIIRDVIIPENAGIVLLEDHNLDMTNYYEDAINTSENWMVNYGDEIDAIWCGWDEPAMVASDAIKAAGMTKENIFVVGIDGHDGAIERIKNGDPMVATVAQAFELMGEKCADIINNIYGKGMSIKEAAPVTTIYVDAPLLTESNPPAEGVPAYLSPDFYSGN